MAFMTYKQLDEEKAKSLEYKIGTAVEAIGKAFTICKHRSALAFSGGKDSTVLWHIIRKYFPKEAESLAVIFGNTGVEYPESLTFARKIGKEWGGSNFHEVTPLKLERDGLKYQAQKEVLEWLIRNGRVEEVLKDDGKLKSTEILDAICPKEMYKDFEERRLIWKKGMRKSMAWCNDQYGYPLLGKAFSKLGAHRINIDCFLRFSKSGSTDPKLLDYYAILKEVKISQMCCHFLKKEPSEAKQAELGVDVIFKGLMAAESRTRATSFLTRGYIFQSKRDYLSDPFYHVNPLAIWTDEDIWEYIRKYDVPYSPLYDCSWTDKDGEEHKIPRNGCMACGTDLLYPNNHLSTLRRTHPKAWRVFMGQGLAEEMRKLQQCKKNGQMSLMDFYTTDYLLDAKPCAFDRIDKFTMFDEGDAGIMEYDEEEINENNIKM